MRIFEVIFFARGGQGAKTASELIAHSAILEGKYVKAFPFFGPERSGAPTRMFLRISEKEIKHIFDNFERGNKVDIKGIDGFGIGLNYVQKVIKAHKGSIMVDSTEGEGSEFIIELYKN